MTRPTLYLYRLGPRLMECEASQEVAAGPGDASIRLKVNVNRRPEEAVSQSCETSEKTSHVETFYIGIEQVREGSGPFLLIEVLRARLRPSERKGRDGCDMCSDREENGSLYATNVSHNSRETIEKKSSTPWIITDVSIHLEPRCYEY